MEIKTASDLKYAVEQSGREPHFFDRRTMKFFGDKMSNYGVRRVFVERLSGGFVHAFELYRRRPVKMGNQGSAFFACDSFERIFVKE